MSGGDAPVLLLSSAVCGPTGIGGVSSHEHPGHKGPVPAAWHGDTQRRYLLASFSLIPAQEPASEGAH